MKVSSAAGELHRFEEMARLDSPVHRLDPRVKVAVTLLFLVCVVSFGRYTVAPLIPFFLFPALVAAAAEIPLPFLLERALLPLPFALAVCIANPFLDREVVVRFGSIGVSGGWISLFSVLLRSLLCITAALLLLCVTSFPDLCAALQRLRLPRPFVQQLLFLHRYGFVLSEEGGRAARARELRACGRKGLGWRPFASLTGHLLLRTWERADRIHRAMLSRGFAGDFPQPPGRRLQPRDLLFLAGWGFLFVLFRFVDVTTLAGRIVTGGAP